jgi:hypothetical protein
MFERFADGFWFGYREEEMILECGSSLPFRWLAAESIRSGI